jgi:hypothetical protein
VVPIANPPMASAASAKPICSGDPCRAASCLRSRPDRPVPVGSVVAS